MTPPLKVVMVGCGGMSETWLKAAASMEDITVRGFVDLDENAAQHRAAVYGPADAIVTTQLEHALDTIQPDIVFDCTIPAAHKNVTLTALARGIHVLGEKPLADSMDHAREMVAAAQQADRLYAVIQNRRYDANIRRLRAFLDTGDIGIITTLNSDFYVGAHFGGFRDRMEHVLLLDMAIHTFDAARFLSNADPVSVYCKEWNPAGSWYDHDASAIAIFEMSNGIVYTYRGSWCSEGWRTTWECDWRIIGHQGSVLWAGDEHMQAEVVAGDEGFFRPTQPLEIPPAASAKTGGHTGIIREFVDCVRHGGQPETQASDNIKSLAMVFGAIESAERGVTVNISI